MLQLAVIALGVWTLLSFALAVIVGGAIRRLQPIPVRTSRRRRS